MEAPTNRRDVWPRWLAWTSVAEVAGIPAAGVVGVATSSRAGTAQRPDLRQVLPTGEPGVDDGPRSARRSGGGHGAALPRLPARDREVAQVR